MPIHGHDFLNERQTTTPPIRHLPLRSCLSYIFSSATRVKKPFVPWIKIERKKIVPRVMMRKIRYRRLFVFILQENIRAITSRRERSALNGILGRIGSDALVGLRWNKIIRHCPHSTYSWYRVPGTGLFFLSTTRTTERNHTFRDTIYIERIGLERLNRFIFQLV